MHYRCFKCKKIEPVTSRAPKCDCGGLWQLDYQPPRFDMDLIDTSTWGLFRYRAFLPVEDHTWQTVSMSEGMSPILALDDQVLAKADYFMPTLSFKDRGAAVLISHCKTMGVQSVVQDSSGNAGNSVAAYCGRAGIDCEIFVPEGTSPKKIHMIQSHGARVNIIPGTRDHCAQVCRQKVMEDQVYYASHVYNPFFYEGTKTYIYEVYEQLKRIPKHIFVPLGNGTLFLGIIKGLEHLLESGIIGQMPQVIAVQSSHCDPIYQAVAKGLDTVEPVKAQATLAEGIAIGEPMRGEEILKHIYDYSIKVIVAPEERIMAARAYLASKGLYCEHTTAATYAAYERYIKDHGVIEDVLIPLCGAGLKSDH